MVEYYERKKAANSAIDKMVECGLPLVKIIHKISLEYGFSEGMVVKRMLHLNELAKHDKKKNEKNEINDEELIGGEL